ncbi:MAG: hypothetical protein P8J86_12860 [Phycisphaerales bacterium]|nr:hypothetical protein [Phycisphaerales bacterium]
MLKCSEAIPHGQHIQLKNSSVISGIIGCSLVLALSHSSFGQRDATVNQRLSAQPSSSTVLHVDVNEDGQQDLVLADPGTFGEIGQVSVYFGANGRDAVAKGKPDLVIQNNQNAVVVNLGAHLSFERDYNNDGYNDLLVSGWHQTAVDVYAPVAAVWDLHQRQLLGWFDAESLAGMQKRQQLDLNENGFIDSDDLVRSVTLATQENTAIGASLDLEYGEFANEIMMHMYSSVVEAPEVSPLADCFDCPEPWEVGDENDQSGGEDVDYGGEPDDHEHGDGDGVDPEEILVDCDGDGIPDTSWPVGIAIEDCDGDGVPDSCEEDLDRDGIPDDCACAADCLEGPLYMGDKDNVYIDFTCWEACDKIQWKIISGAELLDAHQPVQNPYSGNCAYYIRALEDVAGSVTVQATDSIGCVYTWTITVQRYCQGQFKYRAGIPWSGIAGIALADHPIPGTIPISGSYAFGVSGDGLALTTDRLMVGSDIAANGWFNFSILSPAGQNGQHFYRRSAVGFGHIAGGGPPPYAVPFTPANSAACPWPANTLAFPVYVAPVIPPAIVNTNVTLVAGPFVTGHLNNGVLARSSHFEFMIHGSPFNIPNLVTPPIRIWVWGIPVTLPALDVGPVPAIDGQIKIRVAQRCDPNTGMLPATYTITGNHDGFPAHRVFMTGQANPVYSWIPAMPNEIVNLAGTLDIPIAPARTGRMIGVAGTCP